MTEDLEIPFLISLSQMNKLSVFIQILNGSVLIENKIENPIPQNCQWNSSTLYSMLIFVFVL